MRLQFEREEREREREIAIDPPHQTTHHPLHPPTPPHPTLVAYVCGQAAADLGYECTVLTDACLAAAPDRHDGALKTVSRFAEVTTTAEWLATASAELDS